MGIEQERKTLLDNENSEPIEAFKKLKRATFGSMLALFSGLLFVGNNTAMQVMNLDFLDVVFVRGIIQVHLVAILCYVKGLSLFPSELGRKTKGFMLLQGLLGGVVITMGFACVQLMPMGDATALIFSAPIFTMLFAWLLLKHYFGLFKVVFALVLMIGAILVTQPAFIFAQLSPHLVPETFGGLGRLLYDDVRYTDANGG